MSYALKDAQDLDTWKWWKTANSFRLGIEKNKQTNLEEHPEKGCDIPASYSSINHVQAAGIRTRNSVLSINVSVSNPFWEGVELASPSLELPEPVPPRPECLAEAKVGADLAKGTAWASQSPKA